MTKEKDYTFKIEPGRNTRYVAGPFDVKTHKPHYEIEICPSLIQNKIEVKQILLGTPAYCQWGWEINNKSSLLVFVIVKKDGVMVD
jgi:hypothetical protein